MAGDAFGLVTSDGRRLEAWASDGHPRPPSCSMSARRAPGGASARLFDDEGNLSLALRFDEVVDDLLARAVAP